MKLQEFVLLAGALSGAPACRESPKNPEQQEAVHETIIKHYFSGWEKKSWAIVASTLAQGFTFTSPAPDDHIPIEKFREKCWNQAAHIERFEFPRIVGDGREAFAIVHVITKDGRTLRNLEYFTFENSKIRSIEVFFGGSGAGFPTNGQ